jgi:hypothetical protein
MSAIKFVPPLRIEIRDVSAAGETPWFFFDSAQTQSQAEDKIKRHRVSSDCETRIIPNDPLRLVPDSVMEDTPETKTLIEQLNLDRLGLQRQLNSAMAELEALNREKAIALSPRVDVAAEAAKLPFEIGDVLRDVHVGWSVKVTGFGRKHPREETIFPGFHWVNLSNNPGDPDHTGWCPAASIGCYVKVKASDPVKAEPTGEEVQYGVPAGTVTPTASAAIEPSHAVHHAHTHHAATHHAPKSARTPSKRAPALHKKH